MEIGIERTDCISCGLCVGACGGLPLRRRRIGRGLSPARGRGAGALRQGGGRGLPGEHYLRGGVKSRRADEICVKGARSSHTDLTPFYATPRSISVRRTARPERGGGRPPSCFRAPRPM